MTELSRKAEFELARYKLRLLAREQELCPTETIGATQLRRFCDLMCKVELLQRNLDSILTTECGEDE